MKKGWEIKKLKDIGTIFNGNSINAKIKKEKYLNLTDGLPYIATKDVSYGSEIDYNNGIKIPYEEKTFFKIAKENTILICAEGGSAGRKIGFTEQDVCFGNKLFALSTKENIDSKYIFHYFFSLIFQKDFANQLTGIIGGVSMNKFKQLEISIPPLPEQKRIVSILDKAFAGITKAKANAEQNLKNAKELFETSLQTLFDNKNWEQKQLGEIASFKNGMNYTKSSKGQSIEIVGVKNFKNNFWVPFQELEDVIIDGQLNEAYLLKKGDIITVRSNGNPKLIGRTLLADNVNGNISHSGFTIRIRLNSDTLLPVFLCHYLKTQKTRKELVERGNGVGIKSLNQGSLSSLTIPFPNSKKEQKQIVQKLDKLSTETRKLELVYQQKLEDLEELKKSILQKAFNGEL